MNERYLYTTAIPVLLGGGGLAGKTALYLYTRYGLEVRWLGEGWHPLLAIYAKRLASLPLTEDNDATVTRHQLAFAEEIDAGAATDQAHQLADQLAACNAKEQPERAQYLKDAMIRAEAKRKAASAR